MTALVTGATGFVGRQLVPRLERPAALSRRPTLARSALGIPAFGWDPIAGLPPAEAFEGVDTVFHLAGDPIARGRWTRSKKDRIMNSRVLGTRHLVARLAELDRRPRTLVSASAVGLYGSRGNEVLREDARRASGFLADVCQAWEEEGLRAEDLGVRVVRVRTGIVLGSGGGALASMLPIFRLGAGGRLGSGQQWMPWIHIDDLVRLMLHAAQNTQVQGPMNGVSPNPVTNLEFTRVLAAELHRPAPFPVPAFALRLALGEFASVLLASQRVVPGVAIDTGFAFEYPHLEPALADILKASNATTSAVRTA